MAIDMQAPPILFYSEAIIFERLPAVSNSDEENHTDGKVPSGFENLSKGGGGFDGASLGQKDWKKDRW